MSTEVANEVSRLRNAVRDLQGSLDDVEDAVRELTDVDAKLDLLPWALRIIREFQPGAPWLASEIRRFIIAAEGVSAVA